VLEVVQQDQQMLGPQRGRQQLGQRGRVPLVHAQPLGEGAQHQPGVTQRRQIDEHRPVREIPRHLPGYLDGQPGLAHPTGTSERQQLEVAPA
jgi:hypothetical protein